MIVTSEERTEVLRKPMMLSRHFYEREFYRLRFREFETIIQEGEIVKEGANKYRVSMTFGNKVKFVILVDEGAFLKLVSAGETSR